MLCTVNTRAIVDMMNLENADQRNHMESHVNGIVDIIDGLIKELDGMTFS